MLFLKKYAIIIVLMGIIGGVGYYYYSSTQKRIEGYVTAIASLKANNETLKDAIAEQRQAVDYLEDQITRVRLDFEEASAELQLSRLRAAELRARFDRHDISGLARAKPGVVSNIINNASEEAFRCFAILSGAPITDEERNATTPENANSECPWLFEE